MAKAKAAKQAKVIGRLVDSSTDAQREASQLTFDVDSSHKRGDDKRKKTPLIRIDGEEYEIGAMREEFKRKRMNQVGPASHVKATMASLTLFLGGGFCNLGELLR